ncbi:hypothetical protein Tco_1058415 [Tanacetum coccineum]|uniref:Uncharacterized protein n=1 Tax=Tanacetum coccineum TaxID=301880 RepID=A0ABQ5H8N7_9ASTR
MYKVFSQMLKSFTREDLEDLYKMVKAKYKSTIPVEDLNLGRIVGIKSLLNAASITAALIDVNAAQSKLVLLENFNENYSKCLRLLYKVNAAEGVNAASEEVSTAELVSTAYVIFLVVVGVVVFGAWALGAFWLLGMWLVVGWFLVWCGMEFGLVGGGGVDGWLELFLEWVWLVVAVELVFGGGAFGGLACGGGNFAFFWWIFGLELAWWSLVGWFGEWSMELSGGLEFFWCVLELFWMAGYWWLVVVWLLLVAVFGAFGALICLVIMGCSGAFLVDGGIGWLVAFWFGALCWTGGGGAFLELSGWSDSVVGMVVGGSLWGSFGFVSGLEHSLVGFFLVIIGEIGAFFGLELALELLGLDWLVFGAFFWRLPLGGVGGALWWFGFVVWWLWLETYFGHFGLVGMDGGWLGLVWVVDVVELYSGYLALVVVVWSFFLGFGAFLELVWRIQCGVWSGDVCLLVGSGGGGGGVLEWLEEDLELFLDLVMAFRCRGIGVIWWSGGWGGWWFVELSLDYSLLVVVVVVWSGALLWFGELELVWWNWFGVPLVWSFYLELLVVGLVELFGFCVELLGRGVDVESWSFMDGVWWWILGDFSWLVVWWLCSVWTWWELIGGMECGGLGWFVAGALWSLGVEFWLLVVTLPLVLWMIFGLVWFWLELSRDWLEWFLDFCLFGFLGFGWFFLVVGGLWWFGGVVCVIGGWWLVVCGLELVVDFGVWWWFFGWCWSWWLWGSLLVVGLWELGDRAYSGCRASWNYGWIGAYGGWLDGCGLDGSGHWTFWFGSFLVGGWWMGWILVMVVGGMGGWIFGVWWSFWWLDLELTGLWQPLVVVCDGALELLGGWWLVVVFWIFGWWFWWMVLESWLVLWWSGLVLFWSVLWLADGFGVVGWSFGWVVHLFGWVEFLMDWSMAGGCWYLVVWFGLFGLELHGSFLELWSGAYWFFGVYGDFGDYGCGDNGGLVVGVVLFWVGCVLCGSCSLVGMVLVWLEMVVFGLVLGGWSNLGVGRALVVGGWLVGGFCWMEWCGLCFDGFGFRFVELFFGFVSFLIGWLWIGGGGAFCLVAWLF